MGENEYLDSRKARRWSAVAEAVRNRLPIGKLGALILDRFRKTLRNISKDMPLAECLAAVDSQAELERAFDGVNGDRTWKACGVCPACIFRRVSLHAAGVKDFPEIYDLDLLSPVFDRSGPKKLKYLKAFLLFVDHLADLNQNRLPIVLVRHLRETDMLNSGVSVQSCIDLYQRYRTEWLGFLARAQSNGCQWANLIDLPARAA